MKAREGEREKITYGYWDNSLGKKLTCHSKKRYFSVYLHKYRGSPGLVVLKLREGKKLQ